MDGAAVRSGRETTQPNRQDTAYWATGLTPVYLEGALGRALNPLQVALRNRLHRPSSMAPRRIVERDAACARKRAESVFRLSQGRGAPAQPALRAVGVAPRQYHPRLRSQRAGDPPNSIDTLPLSWWR